MTFKYSCFISFRHGQYELSQAFIEQLYTALAAELELLVEEGVFVDWERLQPGALYNTTIAGSLCRSVCMVLVYIPTYFSQRHTWCAREYKAMVKLEEQRLQLLGDTDNSEYGFIIPIIFRGLNYLPEELKTRRHCCDFQDFSLTETRIIENPKFNNKIRKIAEYIHERYESLKELPDPCNFCDSFALPTEEEIMAWLQTITNKKKKWLF